MRTSALLTVVAALAASAASHAQSSPAAPACSNAGLKLAQGFCATVFADDIGRARHLAVSAAGVVYVNTVSAVAAHVWAISHR